MSVKKAATAHEIYIGKSAVSLNYEVVRLDDVKLDPDNPRLRRLVKARFNGTTPTQEDLRKLIIDEVPSAGQLQADVRENGGLLEPIHVRHDGLVIEGNCRTAVLLTLRAAFKTEAKWKKVPVYRFPRAIGEKDLAVFQAKYHITSGKSEWEPYEKANHIFYMNTVLKMTPKQIAASLYPRMSETEVQRNLDTYREFTVGHLGLEEGRAQTPSAKKAKTPAKARGRKSNGRSGANGNGERNDEEREEDTGNDEADPDERNARAWSYYDEFNKRRDLEEFRAIPANKKWFADLVKSGKLGPAANVRQLAKILATAGAKEILVSQGFDAAMRHVNKHDPTAGSPTFKVLAKAAECLGRFPQSDIARLKKDSKQQRILRALFTKLTSLAEAAEIELDDRGA